MKGWRRTWMLAMGVGGLGWAVFAGPAGAAVPVLWAQEAVALPEDRTAGASMFNPSVGHLWMDGRVLTVQHPVDEATGESTGQLTVKDQRTGRVLAVLKPEAGRGHAQWGASVARWDRWLAVSERTSDGAVLLFDLEGTGVPRVTRLQVEELAGRIASASGPNGLAISSSSNAGGRRRGAAWPVDPPDGPEGPGIPDF